MMVNRQLNYLGPLILFGLFSSIIMPPFSVGGISIYLVTMVSVFLLPLSLTIVFLTGRLNKSALYVILLGILVIVSSLHSILIGFSKLNYRDFIESIKYFQYVPYLLLAPFVKFDVNKANKWIFKAGLVFFVIGLIQLFQVPILNEILLKLYLGPESVHYESSVSGHRITLTGSDPNVGAIIGYFFAYYFLYTSLYERKIKYFVIALIVLLLCLLTQSRTAVIGFGFSVLIYFIFFSGMKFFYRLLFIIIGGVGLVGSVLILNLQYMILGVLYAASGENQSVNVRVQNFYNALDVVTISPWIGVGPAKDTLSTIIDSEYALIIQRYGAIGMILFCSYMLHLYSLSKNVIGKHKWGAILNSFLIFSVIMMTTNNVFSGYQVMSIVILLNIFCYKLAYGNNGPSTSEFSSQRLPYKKLRVISYA